MCPPTLRPALFPLLLLIFTAGCSQLSPIPPDIPLGTHASEVRAQMGQADREKRVIPKPRDARIRYVWEYRDHWHQPAGPEQPHRWGNWDLYFDDQCFYRGWRMVGPPPLDSARMTLQDITARPACPECPPSVSPGRIK